MDTLDISVKRGSTWAGLTIEFKIDDVAVNLTGASIYMQIKTEACTDTSIVEFSTTAGTINIDNPLSGHFSIEPTIFNIIPKIYYYDIRVEQANDRVDYIVGGTFTITSNVTRL